MKTHLLIILIFILNFQILPQLTTSWEKTFGGTNIDIGHYVKETSDNGFIITGYTRSFGAISGRNIWLIKTDAQGNMVWNNTYGGNDDEEGYSVQQTSDGGFVVTGYTKSFGAGAMDVFLLKTDSLGNQSWFKTFGGANDEEGYSVLITSDNGFLIAGATSSFGAGGRDVYLIRTDSNGNLLWSKTLGGLSSDGAREIQKTTDGGFIITGWTFSQGPGVLGNCLLLKIDADGNQVWSKAFGGTGVDRGHSVKQTSDGGFIIVGYTDSFGAGLYDMLLIKTDSLGNQLWQKTFGGSGRDYGHSIQITSIGEFVITGYTLSYGAGGDDLWLVKTDSQGNLISSKTFGGTSSDVGYWVDVTSDGDYIIVGHTLSFGAGVHDVYLIKISDYIPVELTSFTAVSENNNVILNWSTASEINNRGFEIQRTSPQPPPSQGGGSTPLTDGGGWEIVGFVEGNGTTTEINNYFYSDNNLLSGKYFYRLRQIDFDGKFEYSNIIEVEVGVPQKFNLLQNYPNPFNPSTTIKYSISQVADAYYASTTHVILKVFDILGNEVETLVNEYKEAGIHSVKFDASKLTSGIYFYQLKAGEFTSIKKMILMK